MPERLRDQLSAALREAIEREGMTQAELARSLGMSAKHINQMVKGSGSATVVTWEFAAFALGYEWQVRLVDTRDTPPVEGHAEADQ